MSLAWFLVSRSVGCQGERRRTGCCISLVGAHASASFLSSPFHPPLPRVSPVLPQSLFNIYSDVSTSPSNCVFFLCFLLSSSSVGDGRAVSPFLLAWSSVLCTKLCGLRHPSKDQDHPLFFSPSLPLPCDHPCIAGSQSGRRVCQRILDTRIVEAGPRQPRCGRGCGVGMPGTDGGEERRPRRIMDGSQGK